jgi:hypothetical protein
MWRRKRAPFDVSEAYCLNAVGMPSRPHVSSPPGGAPVPLPTPLPDAARD